MNATVAGIVIEAPKPKMSRDQKLMTKMVIADQYYNGKEVTQYVIAMAFDKNAKYINNYVKKGDAVYLTVVSNALCKFFFTFLEEINHITISRSSGRMRSPN